MPSLRILNFLNEDTEPIRYHCAVCEIDVETKSSWYSHANGKSHSISAPRSSRIREVIEEVIEKTKSSLDDQTKFISSIDNATVKFSCNLCKTVLTSFFNVQDHVTSMSHKSRVMAIERERTTMHSSRESSTSNEEPIPSVSQLSQYFAGSLKCLRCEAMVTFSNNELTTHLLNCQRREKKVTAQNSKTLIATNPVVASDFDVCQNFKTFYANRNSNSATISASDLQNALTSFTPPDVLKKSKITVKSFHCTNCNVNSTIDTWETHVSQCSTNNGQSLSIHCSLCETLFYGEKRSVTNHIHFLENEAFFSLSYYPHLAKVLKGFFPKYFLFESKLVDAKPELKYYCVACDIYELKRIEKHFNTLNLNHKVKANLTCDLYFCDSCYVVLYGDARLIHYHNLSRNHILNKSQNKRKPIDVVENVRHRFLLISLKTVIEKNFEKNDTGGSTECLSYYCDLCFFVTSNKDDWKAHFESEAHKSVPKDDDIKTYEYFCMYCKLLIFGTTFNHIMHTTSFGHENIKNFVIERYNDVKLAAVKASQISPDTQAIPSRRDKKENPVPKQRIQEIYSKNLDVKNPYELAFNLREFLLDTLKKTGSDCKTYNCWFCDFFSSERKWWNHLQSQPHIDKLNQYYQSKSYKAVTLFCCSCNALTLGPTFILNQHKKKAQHIKKSEKFTHVGSAPKNNEDRKPSKRSESSQSSDTEHKTIVKPEDIPGPSGVICNGTSVSAYFPESSVACEDQCHDAQKQTTVDSGLLRSTSISSNASSTLCDNDDKSEDEGDDLYNVLLNGESDAEDKVSDHELDDSFIKEMEDDLPAPSTSQVDVQGATPVDNNAAPEAANKDNIEIVKHLIIAKGIPPQIIKNKRICFATFSRYGVIKRIFTKKSRPDWLYLMVLTEPEEVFHRLNNNVQTLKTKLGTDELSFEYDTRNTDNTGIRKQLAPEVEEILSNEHTFNQVVNELLNRYEQENNSTESKFKIKQLEGTILHLAQTIYGASMPVKVFTFGSRVTGLATENSDVDIYMQINHSFAGGFHDNTSLQQQLVLLFSNKMKQGNSEFKNVISIPFARVPIVKFTHARSRLNCDLSFKSGLSTMNSMLVKTYLELDKRIKFLVCAVKIWTKKNDLADRNLFTTYAQIWMVLFYLMQTDVAVVPTVLALRHTLPPSQQNVDVEGWNCAFPNIKNIIWRSKSTLTNKDLLLGFFQFYSKDNLQDYVLCTLTGLRIPKKYFLQSFENLPATFNQYKFKIKNDRPLYWKICDDYEGLCVQDPFDHCHNLTKTINMKKLGSFVNLCQQTAEKIKLMRCQADQV